MNSHSQEPARTGLRKKEEAAGSRGEHCFVQATDAPGAAYLQKKAGNQSVLRLLRSGVLRPKLTVSQRDDLYEQEADRVADQVMRMPDAAISRELSGVSTQSGTIQTKPVSITSLLQRQPVEEEEELKRKAVEEEEEVLQAKTEAAEPAEVSDDLEGSIRGLTGGSPLPEQVRSFMEPRFGADFGNVRVHTGEHAAGLARSVNAHAFTVGQDIVFGAGRFDPGSAGGKSLLAHELTHVVQQGGGEEKVNRQPTGELSDRALNESKGTQPAHAASADQSCAPAAGLPPTSCAPYHANRWWLPDAYVNNATCACSETPNEPKANCVRKFLQDRLAATPRWLQIAAATMKRQQFLDSAGYHMFVQSVLTPRIYLDHVDAYRNCCCPSGPAPYPAWIGVTTVPLPCPAVGWSIRQFGSCHGTPGTW